MFVYTLKNICPGRKLHICLQCLESMGHKENPIDVAPFSWKETDQATCSQCKKIEYRFAFNR